MARETGRRVKAGPERTCVGCGQKRPQGVLRRIAVGRGGSPVLDTTGLAPGRGAYLCPNPACLQRALARRAFERSLKLDCTLPAALQAELARAVTESSG